MKHYIDEAVLGCVFSVTNYMLACGHVVFWTFPPLHLPVSVSFFCSISYLQKYVIYIYFKLLSLLFCLSSEVCFLDVFEVGKINVFTLLLVHWYSFGFRDENPLLLRLKYQFFPELCLADKFKTHNNYFNKEVSTI